MLDVEKAINYVKMNAADPMEITRLDYLLNNKAPADEQIEAIISSQRQDGSWSPFWAQGKSSLDATCYRLAILEQVGLKEHPIISNALDFIKNRINDAGFFEEDEGLSEVCPPWVKPGDEGARLYLTSNCGFWINYYSSNVCPKTVNYLSSRLRENGEYDSFLHTHWLAGGLFYSLGLISETRLIFNSLMKKLPEMSADNLAWLTNTLLASGVPKQEDIILQAIDKLMILQQDDGGWASDDGSWRNVHTTLESIRAINFAGN